MDSLLKAIIVCGRICSGKSYTAKLISEAKNFPIASFGGYLKYYSEIHSLPTDRNSLQNLGEKMIADSAEEFVTSVLHHYNYDGKGLVIEGVRHLSIFSIIEEHSQNTVGVFVEADKKTRFDRYINRKKESDLSSITIREFTTLDTHKVELETESLKLHCNFIIDSTMPIVIDLTSI